MKTSFSLHNFNIFQYATVAIFWLTGRCPNFDWCNSLRRWNPAHRPFSQWSHEVLVDRCCWRSWTIQHGGCWRCKQTAMCPAGHSDLAMCPILCFRSIAIQSAVGNSTCSMIALLSGSRATAELCAAKSAVAFRTLDWWKHIFCCKNSQCRFGICIQELLCQVFPLPQKTDTFLNFLHFLLQMKVK